MSSAVSSSVSSSVNTIDQIEEYLGGQARALLDYEPMVDFDEGLRRSIDYYRSLTKPTSKVSA